jgi:hypothetical protein
MFTLCTILCALQAAAGSAAGPGGLTPLSAVCNGDEAPSEPVCTEPIAAGMAVARAINDERGAKPGAKLSLLKIDQGSGTVVAGRGRGRRYDLRVMLGLTDSASFAVKGSVRAYRALVQAGGSAGHGRFDVKYYERVRAPSSSSSGGSSSDGMMMGGSASMLSTTPYVSAAGAGAGGGGPPPPLPPLPGAAAAATATAGAAAAGAAGAVAGGGYGGVSGASASHQQAAAAAADGWATDGATDGIAKQQGGGGLAAAGAALTKAQQLGGALLVQTTAFVNAPEKHIVFGIAASLALIVLLRCAKFCCCRGGGRGGGSARGAAGKHAVAPSTPLSARQERFRNERLEMSAEADYDDDAAGQSLNPFAMDDDSDDDPAGQF